jgi:hypothetical protein
MLNRFWIQVAVHFWKIRTAVSEAKRPLGNRFRSEAIKNCNGYVI